ncbi:MAG: hypothetical protein AABX65_00190 [Nanoarchaeota archaeon]
MTIDDLKRRGIIRNASKDTALIKSLVETAKTDLIYLKQQEIDHYSTRKIMSNYYDVLRSLLEAIALLKGYKVYSHEAFTHIKKSLRFIAP